MVNHSSFGAFHDFEVEIPFLLEDISNALTQSRNYDKIILNHELSTVDAVESFFMDILNGKEKIEFSQNHLERTIIAYLGESLIHHAGGNWEIGLDNDFTHGTPMVYGFKDDDGIGFSPVGIRNKSLQEKKSGTFRKSIEYCINKSKIESDLMNQMMQLSRKTKKH